MRPIEAYAKVEVGARPFFEDPRQPSDVPYIARALPANASLDLRVTDGSGSTYGGGKQVAVARTDFDSNLPTQRLMSLRINATDLAHGVDVNWRVHDEAIPKGCDGAAGGLTHNLGGPTKAGQILTAGHGTHAFYAGFWENGTLFETNIEGFDHSAWPKAGWYESIPYDPLPVYIYDQARSEQPAFWKAPPGVPGTGTPVDGPVGTATAAPGLGYYTTIKGFNDNLKGLSTTSARVFRMDAKDAYPEGTPNNPLAGDNLVFYVYLQDVVDYPCPTPAAGPTPQCPTAP